MDWKKELTASVDRQPLNEDAGVGAVLAVGGVLAARAGLRAISGMHGPLTFNRGQSQAGPLDARDNEMRNAYPTDYSAGALIKHVIFGKSGHDKNLEVENAERSHREALHRGDPKAIQLAGGDPLSAVRHGINISDEHRPHVNLVKAVLQHAEDTDNFHAEPGPDSFDPSDHYDVEHAAAEHLAREGVIPRSGDNSDGAHYYLDRVYHNKKTNKLTAKYVENRSPYGYDGTGRRTRYMPLTKHVPLE